MIEMQEMIGIQVGDGNNGENNTKELEQTNTGRGFLAHNLCSMWEAIS